MIIGDSPDADAIDITIRVEPPKHTSNQPAPAPTVHKKPPEPVDPHKWDVPRHHADAGVLHVRRGALREVGGAMMGPDMEDLDEADRTLRHGSQEFGSLQSWSTGTSFAGNVSAARDGFLAATGQATDAHISAARKLADTAWSYDDAEAKTTHHAKNVHLGHNGQHGS